MQRQLSGWVEDEYPVEACGLLLGRTSEQGRDVVSAAHARNIEAERKRDRYRLAPEDWMAADREARSQGLEIIGIWHSHPDHPAVPSQTDLEAAWEGYAYLILSVTAEGVTDVRSWQLAQGRFEEESIEERT